MVKQSRIQRELANASPAGRYWSSDKRIQVTLGATQIILKKSAAESASWEGVETQPSALLSTARASPGAEDLAGAEPPEDARGARTANLTPVPLRRRAAVRARLLRVRGPLTLARVYCAPAVP
jgi:hypothetical protein